MGLRFEQALVDRLFQGVMNMEESVTYQALLQKGRVEEARKLLLRTGQFRFGVAANSATRSALEAIDDLEQLEQLADRVLVVQSWDELLPAPRPRRSRRGASIIVSPAEQAFPCGSPLQEAVFAIA
jgi:hypothetical protein